MKLKIALLLILFVLSLVFIKYGRSLYVPIIQKIKGKETVQTVIQKIEHNASNRLMPKLRNAGFSNLPEELLMIGLKSEQKLEVYGKKENKFHLISTYPFTAFSGKIGPKLNEGDKQIPEGVYAIEYLNPNSTYYLSLKVNYPNEFDLEKAEEDERTNLGGDIFIHGKSITIGCIPIGDKAIEEVFLLSENAIDKGIKVIIAPHDFRTNPNFPKIESVQWEDNLYSQIKNELLNTSK